MLQEVSELYVRASLLEQEQEHHPACLQAGETWQAQPELGPERYGNRACRRERAFLVQKQSVERPLKTGETDEVGGWDLELEGRAQEGRRLFQGQSLLFQEKGVPGTRLQVSQVFLLLQAKLKGHPLARHQAEVMDSPVFALSH